MRRIQERFFLRFHMSLILLGTALSGVLSAKLLLMLQVENIVVRYSLAVLAAYAAFFCFVKLWLTYLTATHRRSWLDATGDLLPDLPRFGGSGGSAPTFSGGGGGLSGGGGATGAFDGPAPAARVMAMQPPVETTSRSTDGLGKVLGGLVDDDSIVLLALALLLAATFGGAIYLIYIAPHILSEAAFDFLLGAGLIKSFRRMDRADWMGSVFKDTYKPFLIVLVIALVAAWMIHAHDPSITKLSDVFRR